MQGPISTPTRRKLIYGVAGTLVCGAALSVAAFRTNAAAHGLVTRRRAGLAFQTTVDITLAGPGGTALDDAMDAAYAGIRAVEQASSVYRADSELTRLNRLGRLDDPSAHLLTLVRYALDLSARTGGAFDPTVQPLWDIWAATHERGARPSDAALARVLRHVDWRGVGVTDDAITYDRPGMAITLNSINQGYAADVVVDILAQRGIEHAFVDTGEFGARGVHPDGREWRLGVVAPRDTDRLAFTLDPFRRFAATSGDYMTFFSPDFRDHHIFDPKTGRSPPDWSSITVSAPSGLQADGLSTALFLLDAPAGQRLLDERPSCQARWFGKDGLETGIGS